MTFLKTAMAVYTGGVLLFLTYGMFYVGMYLLMGAMAGGR